MKTSKIIRNLFLLLLCPIAVIAQSIGSAQTQVNVTIAQVQSIQISQPTVSISMAKPSHFLLGNDSGQQSNHIKVSSSTAYEVTVKASAEYFSHNGNTTSLPVNTIAVKTATGNLTNSNALPPAGLQVASQIMLSTQPTTIIKSPSGEWGRGFHVDYAIPETKSPSYLNREAGAYNTTIMYTLIPQ
ncbi:hypothetical protein OIU83_19060 [Flavobacterium sp. LS1R49]|uniref:WxL domain-containing protein n=1 Tax=Flavobacterium shii TaxID=2987687 RepID=A0A9X2ZER5_9FLAO|nr:hypothetical protein [Flavobacterium shii]MCV9929769.1 hypothetical protein [Flavobacterium shii]